MRFVLLIPALTLALMGVDLPERGPLPAPDPRSAATPADPPAPSPVPRPEASDDEPALNPPANEASEKARPTTPNDPVSPGIDAPQIDSAAIAACEADLRKLGVAFSRVEPVTGENGCGIRAPFAVTQLADGVVLRPATQLRCATALSLARWVDRFVTPAVNALPGEIRLSRINHGSTYICRRRNNLPTGKMSEHSIGNAIDIMSFEFSGREPIAVSPRAGKGTIEEAFQRAVRAGACLEFTTVLGPGTDSSHDDHLHLDIAERRGGYRLCQ